MYKKVTIELLVDTTSNDAEIERGLKDALEIDRVYDDSISVPDDVGNKECKIITISIEPCNKPITPFRVI